MPCLKGISNLGMCELAAIASSSALLLSQGNCSEDLETIGNLVSTIGSMIMTFASTECLPKCEKRCNNEIANSIVDGIDHSVQHVVSHQQQDNSIREKKLNDSNMENNNKDIRNINKNHNK